MYIGVEVRTTNTPLDYLTKEENHSDYFMNKFDWLIYTNMLMFSTNTGIISKTFCLFLIKMLKKWLHVLRKKHKAMHIGF